MISPNYEQWTLFIAIPFAVAFIVSFAVTGALIPYLKRIGNIQPILDDAPDEHKRKKGTPTMGGIGLLAGVSAGTAALILFTGFSAEKIAMLVLTLAFGVLGFTDDYTKITKKRNLGLRAKQKLAVQIVIAIIFAIRAFSLRGSFVIIPFSWGVIDIGYFVIPYIAFIVVALTNSVNLTDGLDGLAAGTSVIVALFAPIIALLSYTATLARHGDILLGRIDFDISSLGFFAALVGGCLGFLMFNRHPAKIFMGDTGSLALGAGFAGAGVLTFSELFLPICGFVFVAEALSDIIQVGSYRLRGGKRVFKMAPLHHHFELSGWSERKVVTVFGATTLVLCALATLFSFMGAVW